MVYSAASQVCHAPSRSCYHTVSCLLRSCGTLHAERCPVLSYIRVLLPPRASLLISSVICASDIESRNNISHGKKVLRLPPCQICCSWCDPFCSCIRWATASGYHLQVTDCGVECVGQSVGAKGPHGLLHFIGDPPPTLPPCIYVQRAAAAYSALLLIVNSCCCGK